MKITFSCLTLSQPDCAQHIIVADYDVNTLVHEDLLIFPYSDALRRAVPSRQAEHLAGRLAASRALIELGYEGQILGVGAHREPLWPEGIIGSISHTKRLALAAVGKKSEKFCGLGLDLESVLTGEQCDEVIDGIIQREEYALLRRSTLPLEEALTIIFSAKESLFKALFPHVGAYFDFSAAYITTLSPLTQRFTLTLASSLTPALPAGMRFDGQWRYLEGHVLTLIRF